MPYRGGIGELVVISRIGTEEMLVEWQILDVLSLPGGSGDWYASPIFRIGDESWDLNIRPNWTYYIRNTASGWVRLDLGRFDGGLPKAFHCSVGIKGARGVEKIREVDWEFSGNDCYFVNDFCSRSDLMEHRTRLMPDGHLTITCVLKKHVAARGQQLSDKCIICYERPIDCALYRCGHTCMCYSCAFKLWKSYISARCPICRNSIQDVLNLQIK